MPLIERFTPGGNLYPDGSSTFATLVDFFRKLAENRDARDGGLRTNIDQGVTSAKDAATALSVAAETSAKTHADAGDAVVRADLTTYVDTSFAATGPGGATDAQLDAAVDRGILANRVAGVDKLPQGGKQAVGKGELTVNVQDYGAAAGIDCIEAFYDAIDATPVGGTLFVPPLPSGGRYLLSRTLLIDKQITVRGSVSRQKGSGGGIFGSVISPTTSTAQQGMDALIQVIAGYVRLEGLGIVGRGIPNGSAGLMFSGGPGGGWTPEDGLLGGDTASHGSRADNVMVELFGSGIVFGSDSDHIYLDNVVSAGNNDGVVIAGGNRFDFYINRSELEGNIRSSVYMPANSNTENVTIVRTHMGFSQYGIFQEVPTTTGWGISGLTLLDSPIESVSEQHIRLINGGNIRVFGGYWVWTATPPAKTAFQVNNVNKGPIWFHPKLEPNFPNPNAEAVIRITGYTNHPIYIDGALNGFAQKWVNYGASVDMSRVFVQGLPYAGQAKGATGVVVSAASTDTNILAVTPIYQGLFAVRVHVRVTAATTGTIRVTYNNGAGVVTKNLANAESLAVGDYSYQWFAYSYTFNAVTVVARTTVASAMTVSANITPERGN